MCGSKYERELWERERREAELEAERIRLVSATHKAAEPEPDIELDEREKELVRGELERLMTVDGRSPVGGRRLDRRRHPRDPEGPRPSALNSPSEPIVPTRRRCELSPDGVPRPSMDPLGAVSRPDHDRRRR
jgi:hypothetical protein